MLLEGRHRFPTASCNWGEVAGECFIKFGTEKSD